MYNSMKKLIMKAYYKTQEEVQEKLDVFYAKNRLTTEQYEELTDLAATVYGGEE